ncbi:radical SAM protein [Candidatus Woesearchaeota archaeon]|nr:radical SAM protein [Candidatus Woesearchaeota archaeon]
MTTFYIESYGSWQSTANAQRMADLLSRADFHLVNQLEQADIVLFSISSPDDSTAKIFFSQLENIKQQYPYKLIILAGCYPRYNKEKIARHSFCNFTQIHRIVEVVEETLSRNILKITELGELPPLDTATIRTSKLIEIVPITLGCTSSCVFCSSQVISQGVRSYPPAEIIAFVRQALNEGVKQIWLSSQDSASYGIDLGTSGVTLSSLLEELTSLPGDFRILLDKFRFPSLQRGINGLIKSLSHPKLFKFIHVPIYSGSDTLLKSHKIDYTSREVLEVTKSLRTQLPALTFSTQIQIGFPDESPEDFWQTLDLVRKICPDKIEILLFANYSLKAVPNQPPIESAELERRLKVITDVAHNTAILQNERWKNWQGNVVVDKQGEIPGEWIAHNDSYKPVFITGNYRIADTLTVRITKTTDSLLYGQVLKVLPLL